MYLSNWVSHHRNIKPLAFPGLGKERKGAQGSRLGSITSIVNLGSRYSTFDAIQLHHFSFLYIGSYITLTLPGNAFNVDFIFLTFELLFCTIDRLLKITLVF